MGIFCSPRRSSESGDREDMLRRDCLAYLICSATLGKLDDTVTQKELEEIQGVASDCNN